MRNCHLFGLLSWCATDEIYFVYADYQVTPIILGYQVNPIIHQSKFVKKVNFLANGRQDCRPQSIEIHYRHFHSVLHFCYYQRTGMILVLARVNMLLVTNADVVYNRALKYRLDRQKGKYYLENLKPNTHRVH